MGIILFIIIFFVVVVAHELGHFIIAKINGIRVVEFSIGMGPALFSITRGETKYALRLLPIGGACMFEGEDGLNLPEKEEEKEKSPDTTERAAEAAVHNTNLGKKSCAFQEASVFGRIATVVAGPVFNFILAFLFSMIIVGSYGSDVPLVNVLEEGAAEKAGIESGDKIVSIDGHDVHLYREISLYSMLNRGEDMKLTYERGGETFDTVLSPIYDEEEGRYYMGLYSTGKYEKYGVLGTIQYSAYEVGYWIHSTIKSLELLIQGQVSKDDLSGPVGMAQTVDTIYDQSKSDGVYYIWLNMLNFSILLSANLGVLNLVPFPALDGGRLVFLVIEALRGKPVPPDKEGLVHMIGMIFLLLLMAFVFYNDLTKIF